MQNEDQTRQGCTCIAMLFWIGTWTLLIPVQGSLLKAFPKAVSLWGFGYLMVPPYTKLGSRTDLFIAEYSFYIGLVVMLIASGIVIFASGKSRRVTRFVVIVDALILAIWLIVSWL
jgi:hypothetical protein